QLKHQATAEMRGGRHLSETSLATPPRRPRFGSGSPRSRPTRSGVGHAPRGHGPFDLDGDRKNSRSCSANVMGQMDRRMWTWLRTPGWPVSGRRFTAGFAIDVPEHVPNYASLYAVVRPIFRPNR